MHEKKIPDEMFEVPHAASPPRFVLEYSLDGMWIFSCVVFSQHEREPLEFTPGELVV